MSRREEPPGEAEPLQAGVGSPGRLAMDSLVGLAVGDALGARDEGRLFDPAATPVRAAPPPAVTIRWTDDTQMALSVVEVLLARGEIDQDQLAGAFARRYEPRRGYGAGMHRLLSRLRGGGAWREARFEVFPDGSFGNGSAMRVAPLGAFSADRPVEVVVEQAARSAEVTHAHPEGVQGAIAIAVCAWLAARSRGGTAPGPAQLLGTVRAALSAESAVAQGVRRAEELSPEASLAEAVEALGNGSRVSCPDTVPLAVWLAGRHLDDYEGAVETAVAAGGDTDTVAAIVGAIVAARLSPAAIPAAWRAAVEPLPLLAGD